MKGMEWCLEEENEIVPARTREDENGVIRKEDRRIRGRVATEDIGYVVKGGYESVLDTHKMLSFRATTAVRETHCLDLLTTCKALVLLRVSSRHPPVSLSFQLNWSHQLSLRGKQKI